MGPHPDLSRLHYGSTTSHNKSLKYRRRPPIQQLPDNESPGSPSRTGGNNNSEVIIMRKLIPVVGPLLAAVVAMIPIVGALLAGVLA